MRVSVMLLILALAGCGQDTNETSDPATQERIYDTQRQGLEEAQQAGEVVEQASRSRRAQEDAPAE